MIWAPVDHLVGRGPLILRSTRGQAITSPTIQRQPADTIIQAHFWETYLPDSSTAAREWHEGFIQNLRGLQQLSRTVMQSVKKGPLEMADRHFEVWARRVRELSAQEPASRYTVARSLFTKTRAYHSYRSGRIDEARRLLRESKALVRQSIEHSPFLFPFSGQSYDIHLNLARLAREEDNWPEMRENVDIVRKMIRDEIPLIQTSNREIYLRDICEYYRSAQPLNDFEREALEVLSRPDAIYATYERHAVSITTSRYVVVNRV